MKLKCKTSSFWICLCEDHTMKRSLDDVKNGRVIDGEEVMRRIKEKYGL